MSPNFWRFFRILSNWWLWVFPENLKSEELQLNRILIPIFWDNFIRNGICLLLKNTFLPMHRRTRALRLSGEICPVKQPCETCSVRLPMRFERTCVFVKWLLNYGERRLGCYLLRILLWSRSGWSDERMFAGRCAGESREKKIRRCDMEMWRHAGGRSLMERSICRCFPNITRSTLVRPAVRMKMDVCKGHLIKRWTENIKKALNMHKDAAQKAHTQKMPKKILERLQQKKRWRS